LVVLKELNEEGMFKFKMIGKMIGKYKRNDYQAIRMVQGIQSASTNIKKGVINTKLNDLTFLNKKRQTG
jgi:hypothetical protein